MTNTSRPSTLLNSVFTIIMLLGILIMLTGLGLDLVPGSSPGISVPQLIMILSGLLCAILGLILRQERYRKRLMTNLVKNLLISLFSFVVILILLELLLVVVGTPLRYALDSDNTKLEPATYWACDELGCRYNYDEVQIACASGVISNIHCEINRDGFHDSQDFIIDDRVEDASTRILALGDSFTFGASAKLGSSWVEIIESELPTTILWNTGIPGTGNNQAWQLVQEYTPILKPEIVILGFYLNDFEDNIYPLDQFFRGHIDEEFVFVQQYQIESDNTFTFIDDTDELLYRFRGINPPRNQVESWLGRTHLGSLLLNTINASQSLYNKIDGGEFNYQVDITRNILQSIKTYLDEADTEFLILLIPKREDINEQGQAYQSAIQLFEELDIAYLNPLNTLDPTVDYAPIPDIHWSTEGHVKVGNLLADCLTLFDELKMLQPCPNLNLP